MNNFIFCSISRIPLRKRYLVFQRHILTAFFQNCVYHSIPAAKIAAPPYQIEYEDCMIFGGALFLYGTLLCNTMRNFRLILVFCAKISRDRREKHAHPDCRR